MFHCSHRLLSGSLLHSTVKNIVPVSSYSKAPRGLFVQAQVGRIFTAISISPGIRLRQSLTRSAFRAGRNLPDKELRYHRTVIVTAAVHSGLYPRLHLAISSEILTFEHWAGVTPYTSPYGFAESCVLVKQSVSVVNCAPKHFLRLRTKTVRGGHLPKVRPVFVAEFLKRM